MLAQSSRIVVRSYSSAVEFERRESDRRECQIDATTRPLDTQDTLTWGASVRDVSPSGIGLTLCFPFRAGTYLAIDLAGKTPDTPAFTALTRVVQVRDQNDGSWHVGCEFVKPLSDREFESLV